MEYLNIFTTILLTIFLGWYLITNLQWYNYQIQRVITKHHKVQWHILYFVVPTILYYFLNSLYFLIYFYIFYIPSFIWWYKKLDKPLVLTMRVKRYIGILLFTTLSIIALCLGSDCSKAGIILPILITLIITTILEKIFFINFKAQAKRELKSRKNLTIIAITASYGKTSIKNYLHQVLSTKFNTYMTPRSVNTISGIVKDVNDDLPKDVEIYIVEAGARVQGDIATITKFLEPQYAIIGSVGEQHLEYFKTLDNIIYTKMEILQSPKLEHGFVHTSVPILKYDTITKFPENLEILKSDLNGISFSLEIKNKVYNFEAPILGSFNVINLSATILMAHKLGMSIEDIKEALSTLKGVNHRLQKIEAGGKIILDDSFNGNLDGMLEAVEISSTHEGRKVIITPGIIESTVEANTTFAKAVNDVFDLVIITGSLNLDILVDSIDENKIIKLKDKTNMEQVLAENTKAGDLILFANDAPNFI
jgi:UDP-N-acetylmuramoyl-tripeptide--D-alanyl-D-alanine ligase